jgi:hypothetical protein
VGLIAGAIGSLINIVVGVPLAILIGNPFAQLMLNFLERMDPQRAEEARRQVEAMLNRSFAEQLADVFSPSTLIGIVIVVGLATLGGLVAVPIFEKRKALQSPPPLPPPDFSGGAR